MPDDASAAVTRGIGNTIAPPRFLLFAGVFASVALCAVWLWGWRIGYMIGFDAGAFVFLVSCWSLLDKTPKAMRAAARRNDANRAWLLAITLLVLLAVFAVVANELRAKGQASPGIIVLILVTLVLAWIFSNMVYAIHYAHLYYTTTGEHQDEGGLDFPKTGEPGYWEFIYFAFCLGMTFQTSDVEVNTTRLRRVVTIHCTAAFMFNLGILAFTINVLGSS